MVAYWKRASPPVIYRVTGPYKMHHTKCVVTQGTGTSIDQVFLFSILNVIHIHADEHIASVDMKLLLQISWLRNDICLQAQHENDRPHQLYTYLQRLLSSYTTVMSVTRKTESSVYGFVKDLQEPGQKLPASARLIPLI